MNSLLVMTRAAAVISDEQKQALVHDLIECKAKLFDQSKAMKQLKEAHEVQLVAVSRQLLGQAHHMFSRFPNIWIYKSKKLNKKKSMMSSDYDNGSI